MALELEPLNSPPSAGPLSHHDHDMGDHRSWTKGKRSKRSRLDGNDIPPTEEEYLDLCLLMLAQGGGRGTHRPCPPPPPSTANNNYTCTVCHRKFPSYQALGGHKASHKNKLVIEEYRQSTGGTTKRSGLVSSVSDSTLTRTHQCSVCLKTFASGQALGGHKRRHFEAGSGIRSDLTSTEDTESGHRHHGFNLNLPASAEDCIRRKIQLEITLPVKPTIGAGIKNNQLLQLDDED